MFVTIPAPGADVVELGFLMGALVAGAGLERPRPKSFMVSRERAELGFPLGILICGRPTVSCEESPVSGESTGDPFGGLARAARTPDDDDEPMGGLLDDADALPPFEDERTLPRPRFFCRSRWISSIVRRSRFFVPSAMSPTSEFCSRNRAAARLEFTFRGSPGFLLLSRSCRELAARPLLLVTLSMLYLRSSKFESSCCCCWCCWLFSRPSPPPSPSDSESEESEDDDDPELDDDESSSSDVELFSSLVAFWSFSSAVPPFSIIVSSSSLIVLLRLRVLPSLKYF